MRANPKGRTKFDRCVRGVSRSGSAADPRAVCGAMRKRGTLNRGAKLSSTRKQVLIRPIVGGFKVFQKVGAWVQRETTRAFSTKAEAEQYRAELRRRNAPKKISGEYTEYRVSVSRALPGQRKPGTLVTGSKQDRDEAIRTLIDEWGYKRSQIHVTHKQPYPLPSLFNNGKHKRRKNRGRRNAIPAAQERYEKFHGHPSKELIEVTTPMHEHKVLSGLGELKQLKIRTATAVVAVKSFKGAILAQNEKATQLYIEGGDQAVNLTDFGIRQPYHEKEVLGECMDVYYFTTKDHLAPQDGGTAVYHHKFGRKKPTIIYDVPNGLLEFAGGGYTIPDEGIDG